MGSSIFVTVQEGASAQQAFHDAVERAQYDHGHGGYTGTIAEKDSFVVLTPPSGIPPNLLMKYAYVCCNILGETWDWAADQQEPYDAKKRWLDYDYVELTEPQWQAALDIGRKVDDKWGPAGCFAAPGGKFIFFGWASD